MNSIRIGSNIGSLVVQRGILAATGGVLSASQRLSSGLRINQASDDAAGLAIAMALNSESRVFSQGTRNLNDGISYLNIANGAIDTLKQIVLRAKELSVQSANGVYSNTQRIALEREIFELTQEYNRIIPTTQFNGKEIFSLEGSNLLVQFGYGIEESLQIDLGATEASNSIDISRVSLSEASLEGNGGSYSADISGDGRYITFYSDANNLVAGDTNGLGDIFVKDVLSGQITRASISTAGVEANAFSSNAAISLNGRYVAFDSGATNLVAGDTNGRNDIFVRDTQTGQTIRVNVSTAGSEANNHSSAASISSDGRYVVFTSSANNLVVGDVNNRDDIFVRDTVTGQTTLVSVSTAGIQTNNSSSFASIDASGRYVVFQSTATNLVAGDTNATSDIFLRDTQTGQTTRVNVSSSGTQANGSSVLTNISADGRYITFRSSANNLVAGDTNGAADIFRHDTQTGETIRVSQGPLGEADNLSNSSAISADGRYVVFTSSASNLVEGDTNTSGDIFVYDQQTGKIARVSVSAAGAESNGNNNDPRISSDGRYISFESNGNNLVGGDNNITSDIFLVANPLAFAASDSVLTPLSGISVATQENALSSITLLNQYSAELDSIGSRIGSFMRRMEVATSNLMTRIENTKAAESRIMDADIADEMANYLHKNILQQIGASLLAQANQQPQIALRLLSG